MRRSTLTAALLIILAALSPAGSLRGQGLVSVGVGGGVSTPQGGFGDNFETGWHAMGTIAVGVPLLPIGLRGDVAYNHFSLKSPPAGVTASGSTNVVSGTVNGTYGLSLPVLPITPYLIGGVGVYRNECSGSVQCDSGSDFGWNAGVGLRLALPGVKAFAEARYHRVSVTGGSVQYVPVTVGLMF